MFDLEETIWPSLEKITSVEEMELILKEVANLFEAPYYFFASHKKKNFENPDGGIESIITNFPKKWMNRYWTRNYFEDDCILHQTLNSVLPVIWDDVKKHKRLTVRQKRIAREAAVHGLVTGISIPVHGPNSGFSLFVLARFRLDWFKGTNRGKIIQLLHMTAIQMHSAFLNMLVNRCRQNKSITLKPNEIKCLLWAARGKTSREIGNILGISERNIYFHIGNAMQVLGVSRRSEAISKAISYGIIFPEVIPFDLGSDRHL